MENYFHTPFGSFHLQRRPTTPNQPLQAWDAADEYLLMELARSQILPANFFPSGAQDGHRQDSPAQRALAQHQDQRSPPPPISTLVINDSFGALTIALHALQPHSWGDSCNAHLALADNYCSNGLRNDATLIPATCSLAGHGNASRKYRIVLWRIPKSIALLQQQVAQLQPVVDEHTLILAGGMLKHLPEQSVEILRQLGRVDILHAQKKARLFAVTPLADLPAPVLPSENQLTIPAYQLQLSAAPNAFARDKLDIGARFFIEQFVKLPQCRRIADLGCGNGVLGLVCKRLRPNADIYFFDESYQAIASAAASYRRNIDTALTPAAHFYFDDCLSHYAGEPFDLILCNPPFHQNHATGDQIAWRMFAQSKNNLRGGGELWIVGNRHLEYHIKLKRIFGNCRQIAANPKFVVLAAQKI